MEFYGITDELLNLINSYLEDGYQKVSIRCNIHSENIFRLEKITRGIPQGPMLGPLSFLIYINDLPEVLIYNALPILFADDTRVIVTDSNIVDFQFNIKVVLNNYG